MKNRILKGKSYTMTGSAVAITVETDVGESRRQAGVDVFIYAPAGNSGVVRLVQGTDTIGIALAAGQSITLARHDVSDSLLKAIGTSSDTIEVGYYGASNPAI